MSIIDDVRRLRPGDQVVLTDEQTIQELVEDKVEGAMNGLQLEISRTRHIREGDGLLEWFLADLLGYRTPLFFLAKIVDEEIDLRIYFQPDDVEPDTRAGHLDNQNFWLFEEVEDEDTPPCDYEPAQKFDQMIDEARVQFCIKGGTLHGEMQERPVPTGLPQPQFVGVTEYAVESTQYDRVENPELVVLEIGGLDEDGEQLPEGGLMYVFQGANISPNDLSLLAV